MLIAKAFGGISGPVMTRKVEESQPPPCPGQHWRSRDRRQLVEVFRLSADGYATLMVHEGPAAGSAIIREFWQLHREYVCVRDMKRLEA